MSIELVKNQVNKFLSSEEAEVLAIRGKWGIGKTFAWNKFLEDAKQEGRIALQKYSYVSLFGCNSLDSLKFTIFEHVIDAKMIGLEPSIEAFTESLRNLTFGRKLAKFAPGLIPIISYFKGANTFLLLESIAFFSLRKTIICIDDVERKGDGLKIRDILGLVSILKEQKDCKVVIILNDETLMQPEEEALKTYREKVIDIELVFAPMSEECSDIAIPSKCFYSSKIKDCCKILEIKNIRIIKKIFKLFNQLEPLLNSYEPELVDKALRTLVLFASSYFQEGNSEIPSYEYLKSLDYTMYIPGNKEESEKEKPWKVLLNRYSYYVVDDFDLEIAESIERGFFDEVSLATAANKLNTDFIAKKSGRSFTQAWEKYHNTFANNQEEVVKSLYESFQENVEYISPMNLNGTVKLFRDLGEPEKADEMIETYILRRKDEKGIFNISSNPFSRRIDDEKIIERFAYENQFHKDNRSLEEVIRSLADKDGWSRSDIEILSSSTVENFYQIFTSQNGEHRDRCVEVCLQFDGVEGASKIHDNARQALIKIGRESRINALRVSKWNIKVEDDA